MLFDATVEDGFGKVTKVRGNQRYLDLMSENGFQVIDSIPVNTQCPNLPKDPPDVQSITPADVSTVTGSL